MAFRSEYPTQTTNLNVWCLVKSLWRQSKTFCSAQGPRFQKLTFNEMENMDLQKHNKIIEPLVIFFVRKVNIPLAQNPQEKADHPCHELWMTPSISCREDLPERSSHWSGGCGLCSQRPFHVWYNLLHDVAKQNTVSKTVPWNSQKSETQSHGINMMVQGIKHLRFVSAWTRVSYS